jgi:hypothetical protein
MSRRTDLLTWALTVVTFLGCGLIGLLGVGIAALGLYAFFVGIHGGPIAAGIMLLSGAALAFVGYYLAKLFTASERNRASGADN